MGVFDDFREHSKKRDENFLRTKEESSKENLINNIKKKMTTILIGNINMLEKEFGELWGHGKNSKTQNQNAWFKKWRKLRNDFLNYGNDLIRAVENEFRQYKVNYIPHKTEFKVLKEEHYDKE